MGNVNDENYENIAVYQPVNEPLRIEKIKSNSNDDLTCKSFLENTNTKKTAKNLKKHNIQIQFCKKVMKLMFSNFGLLVILSLYTCLGAFMFQLLEQHEELRLCEEGKGNISKETQNLRENLIHYILYNITNINSNVNGNSEFHLNNSLYKKNLRDNITHINSISNSSEIIETVENMLRKFRDLSLEIGTKYSYFRQDCANSLRWKYSSALEFCITVITTIGYGHISPRTWEGQMVCVCYAIIGIPMAAITITNLSGAFSNMFVFVYFTLCELNPFRKRKTNKILRNNLTKPNEATSHLDQLLTDKENNKKRPQPFNEFMLKEILNSDSEGNTDDDDNDDDNDDDDDDDDGSSSDNSESSDDPENKEGRIPIPLIFAFLLFYIFCGVLLARYFEGWTTVQSIYFITSSIAFIGFGDFVPGQKSNDVHGIMKFITIGFYSLFGMAIIGMCISLMQEAFRKNFRKFLKKIKKTFQRKRRHLKSNLDKEREKQEILNRIRLLKAYESTLNLRKRIT